LDGNYIGGEWTKYSDLDGWAVREVAKSKRNRIFRLSTIYSIYDWVEDNGSDNFETWIG